MGNQIKNYAELDPATPKSLSGWIIIHTNCPIIQSSKFQTQVAFRTTEAEYIALSKALRNNIPLMQMTRELKENFDVDICCDIVGVYCHSFVDNPSALELAKLHKMRNAPHT